MIRVVVVDDQRLVRTGLTVMLQAEADIEVVGQASTGNEAIALVDQFRPDVVLMDIRMPGMDGLEATRRILDAQPEGDGVSGAASDEASEGEGAPRVRVLILTTFDLDEYVFEALRAGASGFLLKDADAEELIRAVRVVTQGESLLSPGVTRRLIDEFVARPERAPVTSEAFAELTDREREVVALVAAGLTNQEIAAELVISPATARTHVSRAMVKLHARDRAQLVVFAYEHGLVRPAT